LPKGVYFISAIVDLDVKCYLNVQNGVPAEIYPGVSINAAEV
jgi:hypothetical protein